MKVAIVGGGIGGFTLALSLLAAGIEDVDVFESASAVKELGVGVNVLPHAVRELTELGLLDNLDRVGIPTAELVFYSSHGQKIWSEPRGLAAGYRWPQFSIHRGELLGVLHRAARRRLDPARIHTGHHLTRFGERRGGGIWADFADRTSGITIGRYEADLLVACDGIHSVIRRALYPNEGPPRWNGAILYRGVTIGRPFLAGRTMIQVGHTKRMLVAYPMSKRFEHDGLALLNWVIIYQKPDSKAMPGQEWDHSVCLDDVLEAFAGSRFDFIDLNWLIRESEVLYQYPFVDRDPLPTWDFGRVTLLGDAAHPMYPLGSNGASQAIIDARALARELALQPSIEAAVTAYDVNRRPATDAVVRANRENPQEKSLNLVEERAPGGFTCLDDVISQAELAGISRGYRITAGFDPETLNNQPSRSVEPASNRAE
jgi:2-polyprenyl-6-methoxyphenol hydroxylase-like FAD-dependent oxidoreductase